MLKSSSTHAYMQARMQAYMRSWKAYRYVIKLLAVTVYVPDTACHTDGFEWLTGLPAVPNDDSREACRCESPRFCVVSKGSMGSAAVALEDELRLQQLCMQWVGLGDRMM